MRSSSPATGGSKDGWGPRIGLCPCGGGAQPLGGTEELLEDVVKKGGRTKLAKMAKNKLKLAERSEEA